ncbi:hypothetical protein Lsan_3665 [Legionella santicrucis]|uniref:Uncharacterized protein n=1 Tax=Legionella santicrucis TaxID=45074 RepID=A0A0W0Y8H2_9GAMM|nr:hypothetical protein [Legionella santicrucis]KTD53255.1 hypothetical protein Lsan_3665 [Legionella santicrucis]
MLSSKKLQQLAILFENEGNLSSNHQDLCELINILNGNDQNQLDTILDTLQKYKKTHPHCTTLLSFMTQYRKVVPEANIYNDTLITVRDNVTLLQKKINAPIQPVSVSSYFKILELAGHHISMYEDQDDRIHKACLKLQAFMDQTNIQLKHFETFFSLEQKSKEVLDALDLEFQHEIKGTLQSGDILQPSNEKEEKIIPSLHDNESVWDKIYFWFKNKLTKHAHSALMIFDKEDNNAMHYSHIVDAYQHNRVELHHFLYSDVYRVKKELFKDKRIQNPEKSEDALNEYRTIHENLYTLSKEQYSAQQVRLENNTWRKIFSGFVNMLYRVFSFIGHWVARDTSPDEAIRSVLTAHPTKRSNDKNTLPKPTKMFCSEFVANTLNIAASQSFALFDEWKIKRHAHYVPPEALAEHLEKEDLVGHVTPEQLNIPLMRMFH